MSVPLHHTAAPPAPQATAALLDPWETTIVPQLPPDLTMRAYDLRAFQRVRHVACPQALLRALLAYALGLTSLRQLGAWAVLLDVADLSAGAWRKRLVAANLWLAWLLGELVSGPPLAPAHLPAPARRIWLIDGSPVPQPGGPADAWRLHCAYDLVAGRLSHVTLTDQHQPEGLSYFPLQPGDLVVSDRGYGYRKNLAYAVDRQAAVVLRIHPREFPLETRAGQPFDTLAWLRSGRGTVRERPLVCHYYGQRYAVRLIAVRHRPGVRATAQQRLVQKAARKGRHVSVTTLFLAGWVLLVTTVGAEWRAADVAQLYRARWQVELLFKRIKQIVGLEGLRVQRRAAAEAVIRAKLIGWALAEGTAAGLRALVPRWEADARHPVSRWRVSQLVVAGLRAAVLGHWTTARLAACLPRLRRYLCDSPRQRPQQDTTIRHWLQQGLGPPVDQMAAAAS